MTIQMRIEMIVLAAVIMFIMIREINKKKLSIQHSLIWMVISAGILVVAVFPGIATWICRVTDIQTPSNLIYLFGIISLLLISFYQTILISKQSEQITRLTQIISLEKFLREEKERSEHDSEQKPN